ncbi:hypothetical protein CS8_036690 [Cupriavidus sp. 8B]
MQLLHHSLHNAETMDAKKTVPRAVRRKHTDEASNESAGTDHTRPLAEELEQEPLGYLIRHTHRSFTRVLGERLLDHGISPAQWTALRALWREDGYSQVELAQRIRVEKASLTALLESLEKKGLILRSRSDEDKRRWNVHLTETGRSLEAVLMPIAPQIEKLAVKGLTKEESATLRSLLKKVWDNLQ